MSTAVGADPRLVALMQYTRMGLVVIVATLVAHLAEPTATSGSAVPSLDSPSASAVSSFIHDNWLAYGLTALVAAVGGLGGFRLRLPAGALLGSLTVCVALEALGLLNAAWPPGVPEAARAGLGVIFTVLTGVDFLTAYLATTPGGIDAVTIVALGSDANASLVVAVQMLRVLAMVLASRLLVRRRTLYPRPRR
jgi:uncharacterized protein